ncbi:MAG: ABC transporter substrate-binding protein [Acutalibacteraceae bacterium]|nr:ABC transporter substrate-binding protein [Acutalibacteraceae bacterium]
MKKITAIALVLSILLVFSACTGGNSQEAELKEIVLCLDWTPNTNHTGFFVAQKLGYYEQEGIKIKIVQPPEDGSALMTAAGQAQFGITAQDSIAPSYSSDTPLEITNVAAIIQHNTSGILSRKGEGCTSPKGLENMTYSTWDSPTEKAMLRYLMEKEGADFSKVKLIPNVITNEALALQNGDTDAVWVFYGWSGINAEIDGVECDYFSFREIDEIFDYYTPTLIANNSFLKNEPETAKAFLRATAKGYEYAAENPEEAAHILIEGDSTGSLVGSEELVIESQKYLSSQYIADAPYWGYIAPERWEGFYGWLFDNGLVSKDIRTMGYSNDYLAKN